MSTIMKSKHVFLCVLGTVLSLAVPILAHPEPAIGDLITRIKYRSSSSEEENSNANAVRGRIPLPPQNLAQTSGGPCGDSSWTAYLNEKCFKILPMALSPGEAGPLCESYNADPSSTVLTIKSQDEQEFVQRFVFVDNRVQGNVWLAAKRVYNTMTFQWNADNSQVQYSNWDSNSPSDNPGKNCVQMSSQYPVGGGGKWTDVPCNTRNTVVCQKRQQLNPPPDTCPLQCQQLIEENKRRINDLEGQLNLAKGTVSRLDEDVDKLKKLVYKLDQQDQDLQKNLDALRNDVKKTDQEIAEIKTQTSVPVGFVYVQYPQQPPPSTIWPRHLWTEVTSKYAGMFFRAEGGGSAPFGNVQNADTLRVTKMYSGGFGANQVSTTRDVPAGTWSAAVDTGGNDGQKWGLQLYTEGAENRPKNMAIRIWIRTQ